MGGTYANYFYFIMHDIIPDVWDQATWRDCLIHIMLIMLQDTARTIYFILYYTCGRLNGRKTAFLAHCFWSRASFCLCASGFCCFTFLLIFIVLYCCWCGRWLQCHQEVVNALKNTFHMGCFLCCQCHQPIGTGSFHNEDGKIYCPKGRRTDWRDLRTAVIATA